MMPLSVQLGIVLKNQKLINADTIQGDSFFMASNKFANRLLELVNEERQDAGLDTLEIDNQLNQAARRHNQEMVKQDRMAHHFPGQANLGERVSSTGYDWKAVGENIAAGYQTAEAVFEGWMGSSGHRQNILNPNYTEMGIAYANAPDNRTGDFDIYWTQVFGAEL